MFASLRYTCPCSRCCCSCCCCAVAQVGDAKFIKQHDAIQKLNLQASDANDFSNSSTIGVVTIQTSHSQLAVCCSFELVGSRGYASCTAKAWSLGLYQ